MSKFDENSPVHDVLNHLKEHREAALARLCDYLTIPSISTDPAYASQCAEAAAFTAEQLRAGGLDVVVHQTPGHPVVIGRTPEPVASRPTVLFYGHYDVQPPDPVEKWETPPFDPTVRDGRLYARGASDDKGQVACFLEALRAWQATGNTPPVNLIAMIEGEEECGSAHLDDFIETHCDMLRADIAVISDTSMWAEEMPAITYALRGLVYFDITLIGPARDLHSGVYGGSVPNPCNELIKILGRLFDENHHVTIPGFYDDVVTLAAEERERWAALPFDEADYASSVGLDGLSGEAGFSTLERRWARPACDINGIRGGYQGEGAKTVIAASAAAKVSFRLAAEQDPVKISKAFRHWLDEQTPTGCRWEIEEFGRAYPVIVPHDSAWIAAASDAVEEGFGTRPVLVREGATIPVVSTFKRILNMDTLLIGFGLHDDNLHSPNEKFDLVNFQSGCRTHAALLASLATVSSK